MKADLEIVCGFIEAGKTAFINALNELTKIDDEKALVILTEDGHSKIEANSKEYKIIYFNDDISLLGSAIIEYIYKYKPYKIIIEYNGTYTMEDICRKS